MLHLITALILTSALAGDLSPEELIARLAYRTGSSAKRPYGRWKSAGSRLWPPLTWRDRANTPAESDSLSDLIGHIEARTLDRPTMVTLDFENKTLGEAVAALAGRSGVRIAPGDSALAGSASPCGHPNRCRSGSPLTSLPVPLTCATILEFSRSGESRNLSRP